ncbi:MAG: hypothetical protein DRP63_01865 [Planctomycetota bacterium]|nr:MAG: hypothetical protein DRP63_01865 [Planctomycetota bacterium]
MIHAAFLASPSTGLFAAPQQPNAEKLLSAADLILPALPRERIWVITLQSAQDTLAAQLSSKLEVPNILGEALPKGSATSSAFLSIHLAARDPNPVLLILPPYPLTTNNDGFIQTIGFGLKTLKSYDGFLIFGSQKASLLIAVTPQKLTDAPPAYSVPSLKTSPTPTQPEQGCFGTLPLLLVRAKILLDTLKDHFPNHYENFMRLFSSFGTREEERFFYEAYNQVEQTLLEDVVTRAKDVFMVEARF